MSPVHAMQEGPDLPDPLGPYAAVDRAKPGGACWVLAHMVGGLDGSAAVDGRVGALSTAPDADLFVAMRTLADVVLVGAGTVRREGYGPIRLPPERAAARERAGRSAAPPLAVVSRSLDLDWTARAFTEASPDSRSIVVTCAAADPARLQLARQVADVLVAGDERVEPAAALVQLAAAGHRIVVCEGGPTWLGDVVAADQLDELCLTISPLMGGDPLPLSVTPPGGTLRRLSLRHVLRDGDTLFLRYERDADGG